MLALGPSDQEEEVTQNIQYLLTLKSGSAVTTLSFPLGYPKPERPQDSSLHCRFLMYAAWQACQPVSHRYEAVRLDEVQLM